MTLAAMPVAEPALESLARDYVKEMTSIRGRRVQRLLKREFSGAEHVLTCRLRTGEAAVLGLSRHGAALCATDGTGRQASVIKWLHRADEAVETQFDLHKDSLPPLKTSAIRMAGLRGQIELAISSIPRGLVSHVRHWLTPPEDSMRQPTAAPTRAPKRTKDRPSKAPTARPDTGPVLLSGGNPQIAKGEGDAPIQAYLAAMPGWKQRVGRQIDALVARHVPSARRAVKWNSPFYGTPGGGWFLSFHCFTKYVKVTFFNGATLSPRPPGASKHPDVRYLDIHEHEPLDEAQFGRWLEQASELPGWISG